MNSIAEKYRNQLLVGIILLTVAIYFQTFLNGFVNFDDHLFVTENPTIINFSWDNFLFFFTNQTGGHYQPITQLTYAIDHLIAGMSPWMFHTSSLLIHIVNILLVYQFVRRLTNQTGITLIIVLFFAIHPMNVESIAWTSGRNGILFPMFYLIALKMYLFYIDERKTRYFLLTVLFFILALMSKSAAVSLPFVLIALDLYKRRNVNLKLILEKLPFIALSVIFGLIAIWAAKELGSMTGAKQAYTIVDRLFMINYAYTFYISKYFLPVHLLNMHFFPLKSGDALPVLYYLAPIVTILLAGLVIFLKKIRREIFFGVAFYSITISMFLQIIPIGGTIASERYAYFPNIGLSFVLAAIIVSLLNEELRLSKLLKPFGNVLLVVLAIFFCYNTYNRVGVWNSGEELFGDYVKKHPEMEYGYFGRGGYLMKVHRFDEAMKDLDKAVEIKPSDKLVRNSRGVLRNILFDYKGAIQDFDIAIQVDSSYVLPYVSRAYSKFEMKDFQGAILDYCKAVELDERSKSPSLLYYRGMAYSQVRQYQNAKDDLYNCIKLEFDSIHMVWYSLGNIFKETGNPDSAIICYENAIRKNDRFFDAYNNKGICYYLKKEYKAAIDDFNIAIDLNREFANAYNNRGNANYFVGNLSSACLDWQKAYELGFEKAIVPLNDFCRSDSINNP